MFTRDELRCLCACVDESLAGTSNAPGGIVVRRRLRDKIVRIFAERAGAPEPGDLVFSVRLPHALCPTLNRYASMEGWQRAKLSQAIDLHLMAEFTKFPRARMKAIAPKATIPTRWVRFTRFTSNVIDEISIDIIGGKMPIDRLVHARIISGDSAKHIVREPVAAKVAPGAGSCLLEVMEIRRS